MLKRIHPVAGLIGFLMILTFFGSTVLTELIGSAQAIAAVKQAIPWGFLILVPALIAAGASGFRMAGASQNARILGKKRRMRLIAANGLLILVPCAFTLASLAARGEFGGLFTAVQALELLAGATNLALMSLNIRDGLRLTGRFRVLRGLPPNSDRLSP